MFTAQWDKARVCNFETFKTEKYWNNVRKYLKRRSSMLYNLLHAISRLAPNVLGNPLTYYSFQHFSKNCLLFFFNSNIVSIILILFFLPIFLQIIAGDNGNNTYILPALNKAHYHRHNNNHNNLSYLWKKWPSIIVDNIKINTEITLIEQSYRDSLIKQSDRLFPWAS